jgi:hypothetical protein
MCDSTDCRKSASPGICRAFVRKEVPSSKRLGVTAPALRFPATTKASRPKVNWLRNELVRSDVFWPLFVDQAFASTRRNKPGSLRSCQLPASTGGHNLHRVMAMPAAHSIRLEVISIHGEHLSSPQRFGRYDQRCVRKVHRVIGVEQHQFKRASEGAGVETRPTGRGAQ